MNSNNIVSIVAQGMCSSCGICVGACPQNCIKMKINDIGILIPVLDQDLCVDCGVCEKLCPGKEEVNNLLEYDFNKIEETQKQAKKVYIGSIVDNNLLKNATSGGICSELINTLLEQNIYQSAFVCNSYDYTNYIKTTRCEKYDTNISKSRYIPVSHEDAVKYMLKNRCERIIFVGTSCAITGFRKVIDFYHLNADNYLLIGLFCDKTMNYNVWKYFEKLYAKQGLLKEMHFRSKIKSGWPGDMLLKYESATIHVPKRVRMIVKTYFINERCLYCMDKLNVNADISLGDNYTGFKSDKEGSSCIIIRTDIGENSFSNIFDKCNLFETSIETVYQSQRIKKKSDNYKFARIRFKKISKVKYNISLKKKMLYVFKRVKIWIGNKSTKVILPLKFMIWLESHIK